MGCDRPPGLHPRSLLVVRALVPHACPLTVLDRPGLVDDVVAGVDAICSAIPPLMSWAAAFALAAIEAPRPGRRTRFSRLPAHDAAIEVERLLTAGPPRSEVYGPVFDLIVMAYYDQPEVKLSLGYDPDTWTEQMAARRQAEWGDEIRRHRALVLEPRRRPPLER